MMEIKIDKLIVLLVVVIVSGAAFSAGIWWENRASKIRETELGIRIYEKRIEALEEKSAANLKNIENLANFINNRLVSAPKQGDDNVAGATTQGQ